MTTRAEQEKMDGSPGLVTRTTPDGTEFLRIQFQVGPMAEVGVNGCAIEDVIDVLIARLEGFQRGPFACAENLQALRYLDWAKRGLLVSTAARRAQGVEGTNQPHQAP